MNKSGKLILYILKEAEEKDSPGITILSLEQLSGMASMNRTTVSKTIKSLEERNLLYVVSGEGKRPNIYNTNPQK